MVEQTQKLTSQLACHGAKGLPTHTYIVGKRKSKRSLRSDFTKTLERMQSYPPSSSNALKKPSVVAAISDGTL
jgi:hypothetical protein